MADTVEERGVLGPGAGAAAIDRGPAPGPFRPEDIVPLFRPDLRVARGASPGLFDVLDPATGKRFTLYEFELAIARMLDGRRKVSDVVGSGVRLGIPVDAEGLHKFARQLWHYGFLGRPGEGGRDDGGAEATWAERERWDEATRTLYQTGLRLMRLGRPADAAGYFEAVLDAQPGNPEATEMLALIAQGGSLAATPLGAPREPPAPAVRRPRRRAVLAAAAVAALAGAAWVGVGARSRSRSPQPPAEAATPTSTAISTSTATGIAASTPTSTPTGAATDPSTSTSAAAPTPPADAQAPGWRSAIVAARRHLSVADVVAPGRGTVRWRKRDGAAVRAGERLGEIRVETGSAPRPELARKIAELERLAAQDPVYVDFLEKARAEQRRASRGRARTVPLVAPASGALVRPEGAPAKVEKGAALAAIADPGRWHLDVAIEEPPPPDAACEVVGDAPADRAPCRVVQPPEGARAAADRAALTVEVSAADAPWLGRARSPLVRLAPPAPQSGADR